MHKWVGFSLRKSSGCDESCVSQVDRNSDLVPAVWGKGSSKSQWHLPTVQSRRELPPDLTLRPGNAVPPIMSLALLELLPLLWSLE